MSDLKITDKMLANAKTNKSVGWMYFDPVQFLSLTVTDHNVYDWIKKEIPDTKTVEDYNSYDIHMPWLDIDMHTGKVVGHEGRHRAAACIKSKVKRVPVALCLRDHGHPVYYEENHATNTKTFVSKKDIPKVLVGQFVHRSLLIDTSTVHEFWASHNTSQVVEALTVTDLDRVKPVMSSLLQSGTPTSSNSCWALCCKFAHHHNLENGYLLVFGVDHSTQIYHAILTDLSGKVLVDTFNKKSGFYAPHLKAYRIPSTEGYKDIPLVAKLSIADLRHSSTTN